jgi:hypothetical protein
MNKNYIRGRNKEYLAKKQLEEKGFYVVRSAGSKSCTDLIAITSDRVILLQIKTTKKALTSNFAEARYSEDIESLRSVTKIPSNCEKQLWVFLDRKGWTKYKVTDTDLIEFERVY